MSDYRTKSPFGLRIANATANGGAFESRVNSDGEAEAKRRAILIEWLNSIIPNLSLPIKASDEELRACLADGTVLCRILNKLKPGSVNEAGDSEYSSVSLSENVGRFLAAMDELGMSRFDISDLEKGSMKMVIDCLLTLRAHFMPVGNNSSISSAISRSGSTQWDASSRSSVISVGDKQKLMLESKFQSALRSSFPSEPSAALMHPVGHKFHEVFQLKQGRYADLPATKISEMMKSNSLDNAPTQSLLSVVNGILDESVERKSGEIPHRVACLLRKVVQEIERRISTQAEHLRTQNNMFKAREEKYQSRIRVLEALAAGVTEEAQIVMNQIQQVKTEGNSKVEENKKLEEDMVKLTKEKDQYNLEISALKQELEKAKKSNELLCSQMETETKDAKANLESRIKELECLLTDSSSKVKELDRLLADSSTKVKTLESLLADSSTKVKELEAHSESKYRSWNQKNDSYKSFMDFQIGALQGLRFSFESIKQELMKTQKSYSEEFILVGIKLKALAEAAESHDAVLAENRKMFNELQELKGNIRVYCRVRPFLPGQAAKRTIVEYIGDNGELIVANPAKPGKEGQKSFKFNKVYGPAASQADVFSDTKPLIRSVLDGYNVCIFAYGQTGSGKTYTMTGPNGATEEEWGVNYRALNDLFKISQSRKRTFIYEVGIQMVEIYNEQVRDLLSSDASQKKLGILSTTQANGLAVPDACMQPVTSTSDVMDLMNIGLKNRAVSATALNERSSRSHSVVTIHVRGKDLKTGSSLYGNLHLVDLAGSERVDRSEVTGDRLREAQHINKSLSALGDVIFALAQKSPHVPYRNSKLTQILQSSLGGQAKTLMFVQLNPDSVSYSESLSTLKFAERVSGVELGAARSSKEGRDVRDLMEQVASLKDTIAKKDEEIERLHLLQDCVSPPPVNSEKRGAGSLRYESSYKNREQYSEADSQQQSMDDYKHKNENLRQTKKVAGGKNIGQNIPTDAEALGFGDGDCKERLSDISDATLSVGTDPDDGLPQNALSSPPGPTITSHHTVRPKPVSKTLLPQASRPGRTASTTVSMKRDISKGSTSIEKTAHGNSTLLEPPRRWQ